MTSEIKLVAIVGSLRQQSFSRAVFNAATALSPANVELAEASVREIPLYDGDLEDEGDPTAVIELRRLVDEADGLIVFTPEYNRSVPAVTKNAIDWLSRYPGDSALSRAAVGIVASTPGRHDAAGVREHLSTAIRANTTQIFEDTLGIASISHKLDDAGALTNPETKERLAAWISDFATHVRAQKDVPGP